MRYMMMKVFILGLMFFISKVMALGQDTDIRCEVGGLDFNLSQADPGYLINFGSFSLFADGKKDEERGVVEIAKFYKLPRTKLILSVFIGYISKIGHISKGEELGNQVIVQQMVLSKKRVPFSSESGLGEFFGNDKMTKNIIDTVQIVYSTKAFDGSEGMTVSMPFLGKKKPVPIMMTCKKLKKTNK